MAFTYCTYDDVMEILSLAGVGFTTSTMTTATISVLQTNAENHVNGFLQGFYLVPFSATVPSIITEMCAIKTAIHVFDIIYGMDSFKENETIEHYKKEYMKTMKALKCRELTLPSAYEISADDYFVGNTTKDFDFSSSTTTWFDI